MLHAVISVWQQNFQLNAIMIPRMISQSIHQPINQEWMNSQSLDQEQIY